MKLIFANKSLRFAVEFFNSLKPKSYESETLKWFEQLSLEIDEDQKVLQLLVRKEVETRTKILKSHEVYLTSLKQ